MELQEAWTKYQRLCWWFAYRLAKQHGGLSSDWIGTVVEKLADFAKYYDESKGKPATFLGKHLWKKAEDFKRHESEISELLYEKRHCKTVNPHVQLMSYNAFQTETLYWRSPETYEWTDEIVSCFDSIMDAWGYLSKNLNPREKRILERRYLFDHTLAEIATDEGCTKQRISQIQDAALKKVRKRADALAQWTSLFAKKPNK